MKILQIFTSIFLVVIFSCSSQTITNSDPSFLLGKWTSDTYRINFVNQSLFIDSTFRYYSAPGVVLKLSYVRMGNYEIVDDALHFKGYKVIYKDPKMLGISILTVDYQIELDNQKLVLRPFNVLLPADGTGGELWNTWNLTRWVYHYINRSGRRVYNGQEKYMYTFWKDSSFCKLENEFLEDSPFGTSVRYSENQYDPPYLDIILRAYYNIQVEFRANQMYWFYDENPYILERN
jgi:hypothetical protein